MQLVLTFRTAHQFFFTDPKFEMVITVTPTGLLESSIYKASGLLFNLLLDGNNRQLR